MSKDKSLHLTPKQLGLEDNPMIPDMDPLASDSGETMRTGIGEQAEKIVDGIIANLSLQDETREAWKITGGARKAQMRDVWMLIARRVIERR